MSKKNSKIVYVSNQLKTPNYKNRYGVIRYSQDERVQYVDSQIKADILFELDKNSWFEQTRSHWRNEHPFISKFWEPKWVYPGDLTSLA